VKKPLFSIFAILFASLTSVAHAQWAVFDVGNFSQNILTAARTLQTVQNQITQLQNEAQMLENEGKNLQSLNFNGLPGIISTLTTTQRLLSTAQGMALQLSQTQSLYSRIYPSSYSGAVPRSQLDADALARWADSRSALGTSLAVQAQATQNFPADQATLSNLVGQSQSAAGALQVTQATNQLLALQIRQLMQEQQLKITQDRAAALEEARAVETEARSRALRQSFMSTKTNYTPRSITGF